MLYSFLEESIRTRFTPVRVLKQDPKKQVVLLRHGQTGTLMVQRRFPGSGFSRDYERSSP